MATHEIPRDQWTEFLEEFTRRRQGARVTIRAVDPRTSPETQARSAPFEGISFEAGAGDDGSGEIVLLLGADGPIRAAPHAIRAPRHLYHKPGAGVISSEVNPDEILEITAGNEPPITYLLFRRPEPD